LLRSPVETGDWVQILQADPQLAAAVPAATRDDAVIYTFAHAIWLERGAWEPPETGDGSAGHLGLLVLDGLLTRDVVLGETLATELVGRGDILRPTDHDGQDAPVPFDVAWHVLEPARVALLDRHFTRVVGHWPELVEELFRGGVRRAQSLAITLAVSHLRRVDTRLLVMFWYLADRWGKVTPQGVHVPLRLTHQTLGRLVGAQRPSVTTSLKQLVQEGCLTRADDQTWLLHGEPPRTLERLRAETTPRGPVDEEADED
jgi:hypothetical protein